MESISISIFLLTTILAVCAISLVLSIIGLIIAIKSMILTKAAEKSTHQVEMVPFDPKWASNDDKIKEFEQKMNQENGEIDPDELEESELDFGKMI